MNATIFGMPKLNGFVVRSLSPDHVEVETLHWGQPARGGDLVRWGDGTIGMIDDIGSTHRADRKLSVIIDARGASASLLDNGHVSISGGPFRTIPRDTLRYTGELGLASFWQFANGRAGAHRAVDFILARPIYEHRPKEHA